MFYNNDDLYLNKNETLIISVNTNYNNPDISNDPISLSYYTDDLNDSNSVHKSFDYISKTICKNNSIYKFTLNKDLQFNDINVNDIYYNAILFLKSYKIIIGTDLNLNLFSPNMLITRGMVVTALYRASKSPCVCYIYNHFVDLNNEDLYTNAAKWAFIHKIVNLKDPLYFNPNEVITKNETEFILNNYIKHLRLKSFNFADSISSITNNNYITRAEFAIILNNLLNGSFNLHLKDLAYTENSFYDNIVYINQNGVLTPFLILTFDGNNCLLLSKYLLEISMPFNNKLNNNYEYFESDIDYFLNNNYYNSFNNFIRSKIIDYDIHDFNLIPNNENNINLKRYIFLLSSNDINNTPALDSVYYKQPLFFYNYVDNRIGSFKSGYIYRWWLRSSNKYFLNHKLYISEYGSIESAEVIEHLGIRPAFYLPGDMQISTYFFNNKYFYCITDE